MLVIYKLNSVKNIGTFIRTKNDLTVNQEWLCCDRQSVCNS